ncbi:MAG TPA: AAA family ATPase [Polyangiaceae bacterium]|nr:AAA family ATPase [Polyangiaceae bacterium]
MRFRRLSLDAFGPFSGTTLDLSRAQGNGLHLIYGVNEAGKSSALRAIRDLLFGIPNNTPDAHQHAGPALRLSASIERDGQELSFVRRKKRKDSLATLDEKPLDEASLSRYLNGLDAASFERLFGLDLERLMRGGDEMLSGQGDVGEALFDAGASGRSVHRVKLALIEETEELFTTRGKVPPLNQLLASYSEQKKRAKDAQHSPEKYVEQLERVRDTRREAEARRAELSRLRAEKEHLGRLKNVLSSVGERDRKLREREALGRVPRLRRDLGERREKCLSVVAEAERDVGRLSRQLSELHGKLERLPEPSPLLRIAADGIRAIDRRIGRAEKDIADLPKRQAEAATLRDAVHSELQRLGLGTELDSVMARSLPVAEQARLQALGREHQGLLLKLESAERQQPEALAAVDALSRVLTQTRAARRIERDALLPPEVLERFDGELGQAEEALQATICRQREAERERESLRHRLELLKGQQGVPSEGLLQRARGDRDARLREVQELAADPKRKALELALPLAALAQTTAQADVLADRLRSEAERVANAEALEQQLLQREREQSTLAEALQLARERLVEVTVRWQRTLRTLSKAELLPREAARLLEEEREGWRELARGEQELARAQAAAGAAEKRIDEARRALSAWQKEWQVAARPLGLGPEARPEQALALVGALSDLALQRQKLSEMERRVDGIKRDIEQFASQVREQTAELAPELNALAPPEAAARLVDLHKKAVDEARERRAVTDDVERVRRELAEVRGRGEAERQALTELCQEAGAPDVAALLELEQRVERARVLDAELEQLEARLEEVCEGENVTALADEARQSDKLAVAARLAELEDLIPLCEEDWRALEGEVERLKVGLHAYEGEEGAEAAQELSATVARMAELSAAWVRRRLASVVLERVVEGYRERNQGPVLSRAGELFSRLTLGSFSRLQVGLEEARLECIRAEDGKGLEVKELSRGTRFQLYLALKLASIERYVKTAPPLPLVLDDVLVEFDESRAKVALEVLAEFSEHTQILLFTHLARDVVAARELADGRIFTHHLASRLAISPPE